MNIILSPAKTMRTVEDHDFPLSVPRFLEQSDTLRAALQSLEPAVLQKSYGVSDKLFGRILETMNIQKNLIHPPLSPALLAYDGIAFASMAPNVFDDAQWDYVNKHLRILSGLYGVLKPLDGIFWYRLEMQQKIPFSLYSYWGNSLADALDEGQIINLASKEYSKVISRYRPVVNVFFVEEDETGTRKEKGVYVKIARGTMVRWMAEHNIQNAQQLEAFDELGYRFDPDASDDANKVFVRKDAHHD